MKIKKLLVLICAISLFPAGGVFAANKIAELSKRADKSYKVPRVEELTLSNGMRVMFLSDKSVPLLNVSMIGIGGAIFDGAQKKGLASVTATLLKDGGTLKMKPKVLRQFLDENAIDVGFSAANDSFNGAFSSLSKDAKLSFELFFEMMFAPAFDEGELSLIKRRSIDSLRRALELPSPIAGREFRQLVYGATSPWGELETTESIANIERRDVVKTWEDFFDPSKMILAVSGDISKKELLKILDPLAEKYRTKKLQRHEIPKAEPILEAREKIISKHFTQSSVNIGHAGATRDNPDKYALSVMNEILGGGSSFNNRLQETVRVKNGLAYEVWSMYTFGPEGAPGLFMAHAKTNNAKVGKSVELIKSEIAKFAEKGATLEEFQRAKDSMLKNSVFMYEKPFSVAHAAAGYAFIGYPKDYLEVWRKKIETVTLDDVNRVAKKYLHPDKLTVVVVGGK